MNDVDSLLAELDDVLDDKKPSAPAKGSRYTKENNFQQPPPQRRILNVHWCGRCRSASWHWQTTDYK